MTDYPDTNDNGVLKPPSIKELSTKRKICNGNSKNCNSCELLNCIGICVCIQDCEISPRPDNCRIKAGFRPLTKPERNSINLLIPKTKNNGLSRQQRQQHAGCV